jgi:hypothetical protein
MPKKHLAHVTRRSGAKAKKGLALHHTPTTTAIDYSGWNEAQVIAQVVKYEKAGLSPDSPDVPDGFRQVAFKYMNEDCGDWESQLARAEAKAHIANRNPSDPGVDDLMKLIEGMGSPTGAAGDLGTSLDDDEEDGL